MNWLNVKNARPMRSALVKAAAAVPFPDKPSAKLVGDDGSSATFLRVGNHVHFWSHCGKYEDEGHGEAYTLAAARDAYRALRDAGGRAS